MEGTAPFLRLRLPDEPVMLVLKSSGLKWELHTLACSDGFQRVLSGPCVGLADDGTCEELAVVAYGAASPGLTAILHFKFTSGSDGKWKPPVLLHPRTTHLLTMILGMR